MDRDGRLIQSPGFDAASGLLLDFEEGAFPGDSREPHIGRCQGSPRRPAAAPARLPICRCNIGGRRTGGDPDRPDPANDGHRPLHAFDAPTPGTGKSLLTSIIGVIVTGREPAAMSQGKDPEEDEKRLSAALRAGDPVILIDNCEREITGNFLCMMLTQLVVSPRILGQTELLRLPSRALRAGDRQ